MDRLTKKTDSGYYVSADDVESHRNGYSGEAVAKLAKFENFYDELLKNQEKTELEMEELRSQGKTNTVKFKQLFANKLNNSQILTTLKYCGLQ
ncbi:MAG: hypothetical protein AAGU76_12160 [Sedimentibacter sp.]|uniref:hypothetical protein n=1 Tax=Sedimentibacter sp. TaxID=1960295 RepID=UPI00315895F4